MLAEARDLEAIDVAAGEVKASRAFEVDLGSRGCGQRQVIQLDEVGAALVALACGGEDLVGLQIEKSEPHGAVAGDALEVSAPAAGAVFLLGIEGDDGMATFPGALGIWITPEADAVADGPDADQTVELAAGCCHSRGDRVGVVQGAHLVVEAARGQAVLHGFGNVCTFELGQVGRVLDDAVADDAGYGDARYLDSGAGRGKSGDLLAEDLGQRVGGQLDQSAVFIGIVFFA